MKSNAKSEIIMVFTLGILFAISPITSAIFYFITGNNGYYIIPINSIIALIIFLSIATVVIVITSLAVELITKRSYPREDEKYQLPIYGISAVVVESAGVLLFILSAIFAIFILPAVFLTSLFWRIILLPFAVGGIIISRVGLKKDIKKNLAGLGIGFGILLLILYAQLIWLTKLFVVTIIIVIAAVVIEIFLVGAFLNQKILIRKRRASKDEVARYHKLKEQEKRLKDDSD